MTRWTAALAAGGIAFVASTARAQDTAAGKQTAASPKPAAPKAAADLSKDPTLYVIGYSHLDTEWCWSYPQVIREFIPNTLHENFALFEKYPDYVFNWTGANRYRMMKEYYPEDYTKLKQYVAAGKWFPNGSSLEEGDVNSPSSESIIRQVLYGNRFFRQEFGKAGDDFMLPDCFGFPASLPSLLAHCGLKGFSTQKLTWGSAVGIPFNVGVWVGPDGKGIVSAFNPGSYTSGVGNDLSHDENWLKRVQEDGQQTGLFADYCYYGVGDRGGAPHEDSVRWVQQSRTAGGPLRIVSGPADQMFHDLTPAEIAKLPRYQGDLLLTEHSAGSLTSQAAQKRWNRKNELLGDAAERVSVAADWLGALPYDRQRITDAWWRFLPGQFHDLMAGTALPKAYEFAWNDQVIAQNEFAGVLTAGVGGVARALDTRAQGVPLVVYNPLSIAREDVVEATVAFPGGKAPAGVRVVGPDGKETPAQIVGRDGANVRLLFLALVPSVGFAAYDVRPAASAAAPAGSALKVTASTLENARYRVRLNAHGDVASVYDKQVKRELLSAPARLALQYENPAQYPAWNMDWDDQQKPPRAYVSGPAKVEIVEQGAVRVALRVTRTTEGSTFVQTIRLASGAAGDRVEFATRVDWQGKESALKAVFPLSAANEKATYNWGVGTIARGNNDPKKYEVPAHEWIDLTDKGGAYGASVLDDCKYGSDKPDDHTLRLTLLYTPGIRGGYYHQRNQDWGRSEMLYGLTGHAGDWRKGNTQWVAERLNQPLRAFQTPAHAGPLGRAFSLLRLSSPQVGVMALKKAEASDEVIVRVNELSGRAAPGVRLAMDRPIVSAREVDGQERPLDGATVANGQLAFDLTPYTVRAFALKLGKAPARVAPPRSTPLALPYNVAASSAIGKADGNFDGHGRALPGDLLPAQLSADGVAFTLASAAAPGAKNAVSCHGQTIALPAGTGRRVYLLAASANEDRRATFHVGGQAVTRTIQAWDGYIGQWDTRLWEGEVPELTYGFRNALAGLTPGYIKTASVAWYADHRRLADGTDDPYQFCYLFRYAIDVPDGAKTLTLPSDPAVRVLAATVAQDPDGDSRPALALYDDMSDRPGDTGPTIAPQGGRFTDSLPVTLNRPLYWKAGDTLRYTLDGSDPGPNAPAYSGPFYLAKDATLRVRQVDAQGRPASTVTAARFQVRDVTPPSVVAAAVTSFVPEVAVTFSEPVAKASAENAARYALQPAVPVKSAVLAADGRTVTLTLGAPLAAGTGYKVTAAGVRDLSPAANAVPAGRAAVAIAPLTPVFADAAEHTFSGSDDGFTKRSLSSLPTSAKDPWTISFWVEPGTAPDELTILGGFGDGQDSGGAERFLINYHGGLHFWGGSVDVSTGVPFEPGRWQMVTATFDGATLHLYKDGKELKAEPIALNDARPVVHLAPLGPWEHRGRRFSGKIRGFSVWNRALPSESVKALLTVASPQS